MLTKLRVKNFKNLAEAEIELGQLTLLVGPNNSGKTNALQALALWEIGIRHWLTKHGKKQACNSNPKNLTGATISRLSLHFLPVSAAKLLWHELRTGKNNIEIEVEGITGGQTWSCGLEFYYANPEFFYCRPLKNANGDFNAIPLGAKEVKTAVLPPMSGIAAHEARHDPGTIKLRLGEGRTAEILRNLWHQIYYDENLWNNLIKQMSQLFDITLLPPHYDTDRGEITMEYKDSNGTRLDLASSGRGQLQTMLLLAYMACNPGSVLLVEEPDAHLEILRQQEIYGIIRDTAAQTNSQLIISSHSEAILNQAADSNTVIALLGKPHKISTTDETLQTLAEFGFENYLLAETKGWILYLEDSTDLVTLQQFAAKLDHPAQEVLKRPFVKFFGNNPESAARHFYALWEAKPELVAIATFDHNIELPLTECGMVLQQWQQHEIENYLCKRKALLSYAGQLETQQICGQGKHGDVSLWGTRWKDTMDECIDQLERALKILREEPWSSEIKAGDKFLKPLFNNFCEAIELPDLIRKIHFHEIVAHMDPEDIDPEVTEKLDKIVEVANQAKPRT